MDNKVDFLIFWLDDEVYNLFDFGDFGVVDVFGEFKGFIAVLDFELAACHICCIIEFYLKIIEKQLIDLDKHVLVHSKLM